MEEIEKLPIPDGFKESLIRRQVLLSTLVSLNSTNYEQCYPKIHEQIPVNTANAFETFFLGWNQMINRQRHKTYAFGMLIHLIFRDLPANIKPNAETCIKIYSPEIFALLVQFGDYTIEEFFTCLDNHIEWHHQALINLIMCLGPILDIPNLERLYVLISDSYRKPTNMNNNPFPNFGGRGMFRFGRNSMNSDSNFTGNAELPSISKQMLIKLYDDQFQIPISYMKNSPKTENILSCIINDDLDYFKANFQSEIEPILKEHEYSFLYSLIGVRVGDSLYSVSARFRASKIFGYLLELYPSSSHLIQAVNQIILNENLEMLKMVSNKVPLPLDVFFSSLGSTNIALVQHCYDKCMGKPFHFGTLGPYNEERNPLPPSSMLFIIDHTINPLRMFNTVFEYDSLFPIGDFLGLLLLKCGPTSETLEENQQIFQYLMDNQRTDVIEGFFKQYKPFIDWKRLMTVYFEHHSRQWIEMITTVFGPFDEKSISSIISVLFDMSESDAIRQLFSYLPAESLTYKTNLNLTPLIYAALYAPLNLIQFLFSIPGADINNTRHPELGAPLHFAVWRGDLPIVQFMLGLEGIDVNRLDGFNKSPLSYSKSPAISIVLFQRGARFPSEKSLNDFSDLDFVRTSNSLMFATNGRGPSHIIKSSLRNNFGFQNNGWNRENNFLGGLGSGSLSPITSRLVNRTMTGYSFGGMPNTSFEFSTRTVKRGTGPFGFAGQNTTGPFAFGAGANFSYGGAMTPQNQG